MYYFDPQQQVFLVDGIHPDIPGRAVPVSADDYAVLIDARSSGCLLYVADGRVTATPPPPDGCHEWDGSAWVLSPDKAAQRLAQAKAAKLAEVNRAAQAAINRAAGLDEVPDFEVRTWALQGAEAKAWHADPSAPTPTLDAIAAARGVPPEILKQKAYDKTVAFGALTATVAGRRQALADRIEAAQDAEAVAAVEADFGLPGIQAT